MKNARFAEMKPLQKEILEMALHLLHRLISGWEVLH